ncbi:type VII secretion protein EccE [Mycolicibacter virginiensis]|uniref:Type VII secretion protein EccE n=1 Tax=Mycolicibacter virginiensis TaxID=1795032 RepID=A0A9X7NX94_9MYCO|nr:type VII secretion protein EccE [Mycolicibacter virginiensis]PQM50768.1 type VII secretion protein EccE [Mycolicibacter virginiensis]
MSTHRTTIPRPGPARIALVLLAVVPAVMASPWETTAQRWALAVGIIVTILLLGWWRGLHFTTIARRRLSMLRSRGGAHTDRRDAAGARATAALRITASAAGNAVPLSLIASYLNRYGLRADAVRITSRAGAGATDTWIGVTYAAAPNLAALQARSASIPLQRTVDIAVRRLADHLREIGWDTAIVADDEIPSLIDAGAREAWRSVVDGTGDHVAAYQVGIDAALSDTISRIQAVNANETWTVLEVAEADGQQTVAAACALRTGSAPDGGAPLAGLLPQQGNHRNALLGLHPLSGVRLDGHTPVSGDELASLRWPVTVVTAAAR